MGVSAGGGMIHCVLLTTDDVGRSILDTRFVDVDPTDGLDPPDRVNAGIDLMLTAAREAGRRVGRIGVAARLEVSRRGIARDALGAGGPGSNGSGPRRQITLIGDDVAVVEYLAETGEIDRFGSVIVVDCGDTGMSLYTVNPATKEITHTQRSRSISGRELDGLIAARVHSDLSGDDSRRVRGYRGALLSACRTAKEELSGASPTSSVSIAPGDGSNRFTLTAQIVDDAASDLVGGARIEVERYLRQAHSRAPRPEAVVLVGGLANLTAVRSMVEEVAAAAGADGSPLEVVTPADPQLVAAIGAAMATRGADHGRLAFIGGRRPRTWLSVAPIAVVGAILAAALMTFYAVSSSLTGNQSPAPTIASSNTSLASSPTSAPPSATDAPTTVTTTDPVVPEYIPPIYQTGFVDTPDRVDPRWTGGPGWATTELPKTSPSTTTRTLVPYPLPTLPWRNEQLPSTVPTNLIPTDLLPDQNQSPAPIPPVPNPETLTPTTTPVPYP